MHLRISAIVLNARTGNVLAQKVADAQYIYSGGLTVCYHIPLPYRGNISSQMAAVLLGRLE